LLTDGKATVVSAASAAILFTQIQNDGIPFGYHQANCHNIAHYICLLAKAQNITLAKIWAFTPGIYTASSRRVISFTDQNKLSPTGKIDWGYHVAPVILVEEEGAVVKMAIDPVLFPEGPVPYKAWLDRIKTKKLIYLLMDAEWYLFNTSYSNNTQLEFFDMQTDEPVKPNVIFPYWFANKCVTDFFKYEEDSLLYAWLEKGLAVNDTASEFYENEIKPILDEPSASALLKDYRDLVGNVFNFETVFRDYMYNYEMNIDFYERHALIIEEYRNVFNTHVEKWKQKVAELGILL
jgi:hypothetical protein